MKTINVGIPMEIAQLMSDDGKLNPTDIRFFLYNAYFNKVGVLSKAKEPLYARSIRIDDELYDLMLIHSDNLNMTMKDYTASLFETYYMELR